MHWFLFPYRACSNLNMTFHAMKQGETHCTRLRTVSLWLDTLNLDSGSPAYRGMSLGRSFSRSEPYFLGCNDLRWLWWRIKWNTHMNTSDGRSSVVLSTFMKVYENNIWSDNHIVCISSSWLALYHMTTCIYLSAEVL